MLALSPLPVEGAGCRFRIAQFIPYLQSVGIEVTLRTLYDPEFFDFVYQPGHYLRKTWRFAGLSMRHLDALMRASRFDAVFIYRELFPVGPPVVERFLSRRRVPIIFDFDDAVFLPHVSDANRVIRALKVPGKLAAIIGWSDRVITGNAYLAAYAHQFSDAVTVIPTCVDTAAFKPATPAPFGREHAPVVGWIGSQTTARYVRGLSDVFRRLREHHSFVVPRPGSRRSRCPAWRSWSWP
jgi:hypothetical protein